MSDIRELQDKIRQFNDERDWGQYHNAKDTAESVIIEAAELLEHFQWKKPEEIEQYVNNHRTEIGEEIADVAIYLFNLADKVGLDLRAVIEDKMAKNAKKYPVEKAKGSSKKYTEL